MHIRFGTDGWRGIDGEDITPARVDTVAGAIAQYMLDTGVSDRGLIVGYDCRERSGDYARIAADAAIRRGINVLLISGHAPTPAVAFAVRHLTAGGAIMITASHNPARYNGLKFIPDYAGPATNDITSAVEKILHSPVRELGAVRGHVSTYDVGDAYLEHVSRLSGSVDCERCKVVVDPLFGASRGFIDRALAATGCRLITIHDSDDPEFGGCSPDPTAKNMTELIATVKKHKADFGVALDGDGDRFAACDYNGRVYTANQLLPLIYRYLLDRRRLVGGVARTVATTHVLDRIACARKQTIIETPVGFKHVGPLLDRGDIVLAGEESGGISIRGHVPDKDAILGTVLLTCLVAESGGSLADCWDDLIAEVGTVASIRVDLSVNEAGRNGVAERINQYTEHGNATVNSKQVRRIDRTDGLKVEYEDGSWWLARPSGTEPVVRLYAEATDEGKARELIAKAKSLLDQ